VTHIKSCPEYVPRDLHVNSLVAREEEAHGRPEEVLLVGHSASLCLAAVFQPFDPLAGKIIAQMFRRGTKIEPFENVCVKIDEPSNASRFLTIERSRQNQ
jgi:hypothetical protein